MLGFGEFSKKTKAESRKTETETTTITSLADNRLVLINPQEPGFFDEVLNYGAIGDGVNDNVYIREWFDAVAEVKEARIKEFYRTIYDPSDAGDNLVAFTKGKKPAIRHSYNWWVETASNMPAVEGRHWSVATEYQYYAFLVWLIKNMSKAGKSVEKAIYQIASQSVELGHYHNSRYRDYEKFRRESICVNKRDFYYDPSPDICICLTGSRGACGIYDLANTCKLLTCSNKKVGGFWLGGGCYNCKSENAPLAELNHYTDEEAYANWEDSVAMLVL